MVSGIQSDIVKSAGASGKDYEESGEPIYLYNFLDGFDASLLFDSDEPNVLSRGWYIGTPRMNIEVHDNGYSSEYLYSLTPLDFDSSSLLSQYSNCEFFCFGNFLNEEGVYSLLSNVFIASISPLQSKGLHIFEDDTWRLLETSDILVVENKVNLPSASNNGCLAIVKQNSYIYRRDTNRATIKDDEWDRIYINPSINSMWNFYDFEISAAYGYRDNQYQFHPTNGGFELILNKEQEFMLLAISPAPESPYRNYYIYSWKPQSLDFEHIGHNYDITIDVENGWNELLIKHGSFEGTRLVDNPLQIPFLISEENKSSDRQYVFQFTSSSSDGIEKLIHQNVIDNKPFFKLDNASGIWGFYDGEWQKLENNLTYNYDLEDF